PQWHDEPGQLQCRASHGCDDDGEPQPHRSSTSSTATAARAPIRIGAPRGTSGTVAGATAPDPSARKRSRALASRGPSSAVKAAGPATSSPVVAGDPSALPTNAPTIVDAFQST